MPNETHVLVLKFVALIFVAIQQQCISQFFLQIIEARFVMIVDGDIVSKPWLFFGKHIHQTLAEYFIAGNVQQEDLDA